MAKGACDQSPHNQEVINRGKLDFSKFLCAKTRRCPCNVRVLSRAEIKYMLGGVVRVWDLEPARPKFKSKPAALLFLIEI